MRRCDKEVGQGNHDWGTPHLIEQCCSVLRLVSIPWQMRLFASCLIHTAASFPGGLPEPGVKKERSSLLRVNREQQHERNVRGYIAKQHFLEELF